MLQHEKDYMEGKATELVKFLNEIKTKNEGIENNSFFSTLVSDNVRIKWEEQISRWGTSFFSSALPERIIPDYFLFNNDLSINVPDTTISDIWDKEIAPLIEKFYENNFEKVKAILDPKLSLIAVKSSMLPNARLARYFINNKMLSEMTARMPSDIREVIDPKELFSSRYWQLVECVHGHLFGRNSFFSERAQQTYETPSYGPVFSKLLIVITGDIKLSLGYLNYENEILYVDRRIAVLLGSELDAEGKDIDGELFRIKEMIDELCSSCVINDLNKSNEMTPEFVHYKITQIAPDIATEVRNVYNFERKREDCIRRVLDELFHANSESKNVMLRINKLFKFMHGQSEKALFEKLKVLITSLFDLFMILPKSKSYFFNYAYKDDLGMTWAIVGDGPKDADMNRIDLTSYSLEKYFYKDHLNHQAKVYHNLSQKQLYNEEPDFRKSCNRFVSALSNGSSQLPPDLQIIKKKRLQHDSKGMGLYTLCLTLEACSYLTGEEHENNPLSFTFLISGSQSWHAFDNVISDGERFNPKGKNEEDSDTWSGVDTSNIIKVNYSILQIPRVVAFFDRSQVWDDQGLRYGQIVRIAESENNKGLIGYPFYYNSRWSDIMDWGEGDFIVIVKGLKITVLRGNKDKAVKPFIEWDTKNNIIKDLEQKDFEINKYIKDFIDGDGDNALQKLVLDVLMTLSATPGEGAMLACSLGNSDELKECFHPMDNDDWEQRWRTKKYLRRYDCDTLRAALRMDGGARMIKGQNGGGPFDIEVLFRQSVRPNQELKPEYLERLVGKGSRHHSAAALSLHFTKGSGKREGAVIVVSADGPITKLPYEDWIEKEAESEA
jgi:hypothetical protein